MDLVREAQAADPEADALFALLDALRDAFGKRSFTAKDVQTRVKDVFTDSPLEAELHDLAGDRALSSAKSLGRVLKFREGRIVHGLRLTGRRNASSGAREYRCETIQAGDHADPGFNGFVPSHTEKTGEVINIRGPETKPLNPSNPVRGFNQP